MPIDWKPMVLAAVATVVWIFQIVALAGKDAIIDLNTSGGVGLFEAKGNGIALVDSSCDDVADHAKAAAAFGVLAVLIMSLTMIVHILMAVPQVKEKVQKPLAPVLNFFFVTHFVCALFLMITWCCVAGLYDRKLCSQKAKNHGDLSYGFAFFIINFIAEIVMGVLCMMGWLGITKTSGKVIQDDEV
eukprot:TRINITY_DN2250_c0_g1_i3.p2 TRINITY_DN2250_c0_g1~~TRINITY_DN2250_c0_g1_i3.p2  ORF type:complete len:187 (+),score=43.92 TRINITY_DN2250_c0_g1_i3:67-627(+)